MDNHETNSSSPLVEDVQRQNELSASDAAAPPDTAPTTGQAELSPEQLSLSEQPSGLQTEQVRQRAMIEAAVYVTDEPLTAKQIAEALEQPLEQVKCHLRELIAEYEKPEHGLAIREVAEGYKMGTKAEHHETIRSFVKKLRPPLRLSMAALETLAVIAYKQPITAPEIMEIRGVQGAGVLKTLLERKLITTAGRKQVIGRPILYKTSKEFLVQFGLKSLSELPTLKEFEELARMALADSEIEAASQESQGSEAAGSSPDKVPEPGGAPEPAADQQPENASPDPGTPASTEE